MEDNIVIESTTDSAEDIRAVYARDGQEADIVISGEEPDGSSQTEEEPATTEEPAAEPVPEKGAEPEAGIVREELPADLMSEEDQERLAELEAGAKPDHKDEKRLLKRYFKRAKEQSEERTKREALETELAELKRNAVKPPPKEDPEPETEKPVVEVAAEKPKRPKLPTFKDYEYDQEKYDAAVEQYNADMDVYEEKVSEYNDAKTRKAAQERSEQEQANREQNARVAEITSEGRKQYSDWGSKVTDDIRVSETMMHLINTEYEPDVAAKLVYWLATNPAETKRISEATVYNPKQPHTLPTVMARAARELAKVEASFAVAAPPVPPAAVAKPPEKPKPPVSRAAPPIQPVRTNPAPTSGKNPDEMSQAEYEEWRANGGGKRR